MAMPHFEVNINNEGGDPILHLHGEIDFATAPILQNALTKTITDETEHITLDFHDVTFLDSEGLKVLLQSLQQLREHGGTMNMHGCNKFITKTFEILGIQKLFGIGEEDAKNHM